MAAADAANACTQWEKALFPNIPPQQTQQDALAAIAAADQAAAADLRYIALAAALDRLQPALSGPPPQLSAATPPAELLSELTDVGVQCNRVG